MNGHKNPTLLADDVGLGLFSDCDLSHNRHGRKSIYICKVNLSFANSANPTPFKSVKSV